VSRVVERRNHVLAWTTALVRRLAQNRVHELSSDDGLGSYTETKAGAVQILHHHLYPELGLARSESEEWHEQIHAEKNCIGSTSY
jgi:hypothetical protein